MKESEEGNYSYQTLTAGSITIMSLKLKNIGAVDEYP